MHTSQNNVRVKLENFYGTHQTSFKYAAAEYIRHPCIMLVPWRVTHAVEKQRDERTQDHFAADTRKPTTVHGHCYSAETS